MHEVHSADAVIVGDMRLKVTARQKERRPEKRDVDCTRSPLRLQRRAAVPLLFPPPKATHQRATIECECEYATGCNQASGGAQCVMHGCGVMQDPPSIDHVEAAETAHIFGI